MADGGNHFRDATKLMGGRDHLAGGGKMGEGLTSGGRAGRGDRMQRYIRIPLATDAAEALCGGCPHAAVLSEEEAAGYLEPGEDARTTVYVCSIFRQGSMRRRLQVLKAVRPENRFDLARLRECRAVETVEVSLDQLRELGKQ